MKPKQKNKNKISGRADQVLNEGVMLSIWYILLLLFLPYYEQIIDDWKFSLKAQDYLVWSLALCIRSIWWERQPGDIAKKETKDLQDRPEASFVSWKVKSLWGQIPIVGTVRTISPSFSLYRIVVFPDASSPTMRILTSVLGRNLLANRDMIAPIRQLVKTY